MDESHQLLRDYAERGSETAFRRLVELHLGLVHSVALRALGGDAALAADCAQLVFTDLARKAKRLPLNTVLAGWLYRHTRFTASKLSRGESRRRLRERQAVTMNPKDDDGSVWLQLEDKLDEALTCLSAADRNALLLRFFQQQDFRAVAAALDVSESAAQKRVERAVEKLRCFFKRQGVTVSSGTLAALLASHGVITCPASMTAAAISATALTQGAVGVGLLEGILLMSKLKVLTAGAVVVAGAVTPFYWQHQTISRLTSENARLRMQAVARPSPAPLAAPDDAQSEAKRLELIRLRGEVARLRREQANAQPVPGQTLRAASNGTTSPTPLAAQEFVPSAEWRDAGFSSPAAALETTHWAIRNANVDRFKESIVITDEARKILNTLLERMKSGASPEMLAEVEQRGWGAEEGLLFPMIAQDRKQGYTGYRVLSQHGLPADELLLEVQLEMSSAPPQTRTYRMKQFGDAWKQVYDVNALPLPADVKQKALTSGAKQ